MHVLFVALNWGMGHASRSVPLIREWIRVGAKVTLASDGVAAALFRSEFPTLVVHELPSYKVSYPSRNIYVNVLMSAWNIMRAISRERRWLKAFRQQHNLDLIISDNRYGMVAADIPSILITHQLRLFGSWPWANRIGEFFIRRWILRFNEVWVPDWEGEASLTGGMATWKHTKPPVYYIGPLSRFASLPANHPKDINLIAVLSGPEPQRSYFEEKVRAQLSGMEGHHIIVRGTHEPATAHWAAPAHVQMYDFLPADQIQQLLARSEMQISRSGYSTVMDLVFSGIPALLVPTPGQFEQEYLCRFLEGKGPWQFQLQDQLDIPLAWKQRRDTPTSPLHQPEAKEVEKVVAAFLKRNAFSLENSKQELFPELAH